MSWMRCSACKRDIAYGAIHWICSVSTCNRHNTNYKFCSVSCWDSHVATLRHRDAWAVEERAPSRQAAENERDLTSTAELRSPLHRAAASAPAPRPAPSATPAPAPAPRPVPAPAAAAPPPSAPGEPARRMVPPPAAPAPASAVKLEPASEDDILIVVSKMKKYIRDRSGMNTSDSVAEALSDHVRALCDDAIRAAGTDGRRTVLDRDVARIRR